MVVTHIPLGTLVESTFNEMTLNQPGIDVELASMPSEVAGHIARLSVIRGYLVSWKCYTFSLYLYTFRLIEIC